MHMEHMAVPVESILAMVTAVVAIAGLMATLSRDNRTRAKEREEDVEARSKADVKLDFVARDVREVKSGLDRLDGRVDALARDSARLEERVGRIEERMDGLEGKHDECMMRLGPHGTTR